ncbi:zinc finger BED domain-containing protein 5-like [Latimeria chalumnae]|uniref:zinc finger BED domain-containing protein 5-like n=1 Tax=Latimeria chalumnae TaxID=7897 RepID=UPI00313B321C
MCEWAYECEDWAMKGCTNMLTPPLPRVFGVILYLFRMLRSKDGSVSTMARFQGAPNAWIKQVLGTSALAEIAGETTTTDSTCESQPVKQNVDTRDKTGSISKRCKYDEKYIEMGFTWTGADEYPQPQCVLCGEVLSNNSLKPSLLRRHLETKHEHHKDKPPEFFKQMRAQIMASKKVLRSAAAADNIKALEASYLVSYRVAKSGKPHTIAEELMLPAAADMVSTMLGEKAQKLIQLVPLSNNTVSHRIDDMANDVLTQLVNHVISSQYFALQLDESTDMVGLAHLLVYVWYIYKGAIQEDILFCQSLPIRTTAEEIFQLLDSFINQHDIVWSKCIGSCTDGAKSMTGRHSGVVTRIRAVAPNAMWVHCSIHREALAAKSMPTNLKEVLDNAVKMVNFIKARPLNSRIFSALCNEMGSEHINLLLHMEVRWLSQGKVLARFFELHSEVKVFFTDHPFPLSHCLHDTAWLSRLGYLSDIFSRLNELNLRLQGLIPMPQDLSIKEQENLLDISTDGGLKIEFQQKQLAEFWIQMRAKFPELSDRAVKMQGKMSRGSSSMDIFMEAAIMELPGDLRLQHPCLASDSTHKADKMYIGS